MLPNRFASPGWLGRLIRFSVLPVLGLLILGRAEAEKLKPLRVDDVRQALLETKRDSALGEPPLPRELVEQRRRLQTAAEELPSLAEVSRALLLTEWGVTALGLDVPASLAEIKKAVQNKSDKAFENQVQSLMRNAKEESDRRAIGSAIQSEIRRHVRLQLLDRLVRRLRFYVSSPSESDRIAAANLLSETLTRSRREYAIILSPEEKKKDAAQLTGRYLRRQLRDDLQPDVTKLLSDPQPQVRVAGMRALSNLEIKPQDLTKSLKPLLLSGGSDDVVVRRGAAAAMANALEVLAGQWERDKFRTQDVLDGVRYLMPLAADALSDRDLGVRRASLSACQRSALLLSDMARNPALARARREQLRPVIAVIEESLPALNRKASDPEPSIRIAACHVLETLVLAVQRARYQGGRSTPGVPDPTVPSLPPPSDMRERGMSPPPRRNRQGSARRPGQWATARADSTAQKSSAAPRDEETPVVRLAPPVRLPESPAVVRRISFDEPRLGELPQPRKEETRSGILDAMKKALSDPDYRVRLSAVDVLETMEEAAVPAIPEMVKALCDSNKFVRWGAARTLGRLNPRRADEVVPGLVGLLNDREDPSVRIAAADALREYGPAAKAAVPHLARVINRGDKDYVIAILETIQGIGTDAAPALPNVAWIMRDRDSSGNMTHPPPVRIEAARTLGRFGALAKPQLPALREAMLNDPDPTVRAAVSNAILSVDRPER